MSVLRRSRDQGVEPPAYPAAASAWQRLPDFEKHQTDVEGMKELAS